MDIVLFAVLFAVDIIYFRVVDAIFFEMSRETMALTGVVMWVAMWLINVALVWWLPRFWRWLTA